MRINEFNKTNLNNHLFHNVDLNVPMIRSIGPHAELFKSLASGLFFVTKRIIHKHT